MVKRYFRKAVVRENRVVKSLQPKERGKVRANELAGKHVRAISCADKLCVARAGVRHQFDDLGTGVVRAINPANFGRSPAL